MQNGSLRIGWQSDFESSKSEKKQNTQRTEAIQTKLSQTWILTWSDRFLKLHVSPESSLKDSVMKSFTWALSRLYRTLS